MSKSTFRILFYLRKNYLNKSGKAGIMIRLTVNGDMVQFSSKLDIEPSLWDTKAGKAAGNSVKARQMNSMLEDIDHSKIKAKSPQTNGICERFNRTVQNEFYAIAFRKKIYTSIEQLQADLDTWMNSYNTQRTHSGKYCFGKTPMQTFLEGIEVARRYQLQDAGKIQPDEQVIGSPGCESENSCVSSQMASDTFFVR